MTESPEANAENFNGSEIKSNNEGGLREGRLTVEKIYNAGSAVRAVNFSPSGKEIVVGTYKGNVKILSLEGEQLEEVATCEALRKDNVYDAIFSPAGDLVVVGRADGLEIFSLNTKDRKGNPWLLYSSNPLNGYVWFTKFSRNGERLLIGGFGNKVQVYRITKTPIIGGVSLNEMVEYTTPYPANVSSGDFSPDGKNIVIAYGGTVQVLSLREGKLEVVAEYKSRASVSTANFSPDGKNIVIAAYNKVQVLSLREGQLEVVAEHKVEGGVSTANFSPDGKNIVIAAYNKVQVLSLREGQLEVVAEHKVEGEVSTANFSPNGENIVVGCKDGSVLILR